VGAVVIVGDALGPARGTRATPTLSPKAEAMTTPAAVSDATRAVSRPAGGSCRVGVVTALRPAESEAPAHEWTQNG
jgi:hypothetical protein